MSPPDAPNVEGIIELDGDGDGVSDRVDNCVDVPNPDQHDLDHDGSGNACDRCPLWIGGFDDRDGDGIGDLCDPSPAMPGDRVVLVDELRTIDAEHWQSNGSWFVGASGLFAVPGTTARLTSTHELESPSIEVFLQVVDAEAAPRAIEIQAGEMHCRLVHEAGFVGLELEVAGQVTRSPGVGLRRNLYRLQAATRPGHSRCLATDFDRFVELVAPAGHDRGPVAITAEHLGVGLIGGVVYASPTSR